MYRFLRRKHWNVFIYFFFPNGNPPELAEMKTTEMLKSSRSELKTYFTASPKYKCNNSQGTSRNRSSSLDGTVETKMYLECCMVHRPRETEL